MANSREFNGRLYNLHDTVVYKNEAIRKKENLKNKGFLVRITKTKATGRKYNNFVYQIWVSGHIKW
jgi:hypothetical protein